MNSKKEGEYYSQMVRKYREENLLAEASSRLCRFPKKELVRIDGFQMRDLFVRYVINLYHDVPASVYEGLLSIFFLGAIVMIALKGFRNGSILSVVLLAIEYLILIYCATVIFRECSEAVGHNFTPFWSYGAIESGRIDLLAENIMNVVVFVPVGFLLSCASHHLKWWMVLFFGFGISVSIEALQYFFYKGFSEVDDVIHNTLGCAIGIIMVAVLKGIWKFCSYVFVPQRRAKG